VCAGGCEARARRPAAAATSVLHNARPPRDAPQAFHTLAPTHHNYSTYITKKVAVKKMKRRFHSWDECLRLREVGALRRLSHPAVVQLREVVRENDELFFIFEFLVEYLS
jgi:serine/threonine protein kinase